ncbi:MAG: hypothetical protein KOO63_04040 [Bacteroidales bacterium]|nr:hypothetical protein [Candidatus Latescibacterota bacterium]
MDQLGAAIDELEPAVVIYNYHVSTLGWVREYFSIRSSVSPKHVAIHHEPHQPLPTWMDAAISQNPIEPETATQFSVGRILHPFNQDVPKNDIPVIGTFGFGMAGKGFDRLVTKVCEEFDVARIRMHIPFAHFGDASGVQAKAWATRAAEALTKPDVMLEVNHYWLSTEELLSFLAGNDLNAFLYDNMDRGIASVLDFALSVPRPLVITSSLMFQHVWSQVPEVLIETNSLRDILDRGTAPLAPLYAQWSPEQLCKDYERVIDALWQD